MDDDADPDLTETTRASFVHRSPNWTSSARPSYAAAQHLLRADLSHATFHHPLPLPSLYAQLWDQLTSTPSDTLSPEDAATLLGSITANVARDVPLLAHAYSQVPRLHAALSPSAWLARISSGSLTADAALACALAVSLLGEAASDARAVGRLVGESTVFRDKRDGDELITAFVLRHQLLPRGEPAAAWDVQWVAQLAGAAMGAHAATWEDEDIGWSVRYFHADLLELYAKECSGGGAMPQETQNDFTAHLIFETTMGLNRVTDARLIDHLLNVTTEDWNAKDQDRVVQTLHHLTKPHSSIWTRLFG